MKQALTKEIFIYIILFVVLAFLMHPDLLETPLERFSHMMERGNFFHPFIYSILLYIFLFILRFITRKTVFLFNKLVNK